jgi:hypothetical protein
VPDIDRSAILREAYRNNGSQAVAFVDESYLATDSPVGGRPFYLMVAYVVPVADLETMREDLPSVVQSDFWHSTQAFQSEEGRARLSEFAEYVGAGTEPIVVSVEVDTEGMKEDAAREACFTRLLQALASGEVCEAVSLVVIEERKYRSQRNFDEVIVSRARSSGAIPRTLRVLPMSPSVEKLLWLPDLVAYALYHHRTRRKTSLAAPFLARVIEIHP